MRYFQLAFTEVLGMQGIAQYNWVRFGTWGMSSDFDWELGDGVIGGTSWDTQVNLGYDWSASLTNIAVPVPEPTTMLLLSFGLIWLALSFTYKYF